jgi:hypothetical protein
MWLETAICGGMKGSMVDAACGQSCTASTVNEGSLGLRAHSRRTLRRLVKCRENPTAEKNQGRAFTVNTHDDNFNAQSLENRAAATSAAAVAGGTWRRRACALY